MPTHTLLMTGASRGIGRIAAERLREDPDRHLLVLGRDTGSAENTIPCDLASLDEVRTAARTVEQLLDAGEIPPLRGFLGNAGVQMTSVTATTADGFERTFGINVLANQLLLGLLMDRFAAPSRIVITASDVHFGDFKHNLGLVPAPRWAEAGELARPGTDRRASGTQEGRRAYATSKLGVLYQVHALARRLPTGVDAYAYNPGLVPGTGLARDAGPVARWAFRAMVPVLSRTPLATTAETAGRLLADVFSGPRPGESGAYLDRGHVVPSSPESYDEAREEALWHDASRLCGLLKA
ncbi:SDR family NAD(P)-dependent oxidoreductase [Amycolatopsis sp. lyj-112]|uniref:SDR family NAD(P)-dependent oxidoreductase n=1 Tax=Amycolatopsis sp. lyj-112 TaxID=2789288 RepID=UPI00397DF80C